MNSSADDIIDVVNDVLLEAQTVYRDIEYDDPVSENMLCIMHLAKRAIEKLEESVCG